MRTKRFAVYLSEKQHQAVKVAAAINNPPLTMNDFILTALFGSPKGEQIQYPPVEAARPEARAAH